jgi:uncharacterized protein YehS (DUF1456 family)
MPMRNDSYELQINTNLLICILKKSTRANVQNVVLFYSKEFKDGWNKLNYPKNIQLTGLIVT